MPVLRVHHTTSYLHRVATSMTWQMLRLQPRREPGQEVLAFDLEVAPRTSDLSARLDFFGNTTHVLTVRDSCPELTLTTASRVRRDEPVLPLPGLTPPLAEARQRAEEAALHDEVGLTQFLHASPGVPWLPEAAELAAGIEAEDLPALAWLEALGAVFAREFTFDPQATTTATPMAEVLRTRRGVCQDFAHVMIACVRQAGLPASYVSGYLLTEPPPGQPRLRGADAMHAWVSVWLPEAGWVDYDPTNHCFAGAGHVVVARGRDYSDVSPIRGIFRGGAHHTLTLGVTVEPEEEAAAEPSAESAE